MAPQQRSDTREAGHPHTHGAQQMGKLGNRTRESPPDTRGVNSLRQNRTSLHALRTRSPVVKHQEWWWWTRGPPRKWQSTEDWKRLRNTASRTTNSSYTDKAERRTIHASSISTRRNALAEAHLTRPKSRNGHSKPRQRDSPLRGAGEGEGRNARKPRRKKKITSK
jgi:hypothetical protein